MSVEIEELKTILDFKLKNNDANLIDNILSYLFVDCDQKDCNEKHLETATCQRCTNNFCEDHCAYCDECNDLLCFECSDFEICDTCGNMYCNECKDLYLRCGNDACEKYSCCYRFVVIYITESSDFGMFNGTGNVIRCND